MTIIDAMTQDLRDTGVITHLSRWTKGSHDRTYITARGYTRSYRGCTTHQLYWDHNAGELVNIPGKGVTPYDYDTAVSDIIDAFAMDD